MSPPKMTRLIETPTVNIDYIVYDVGYLHRYCPKYLKYIKAKLDKLGDLELLGVYTSSLSSDKVAYYHMRSYDEDLLENLKNRPMYEEENQTEESFTDIDGVTFDIRETMITSVEKNGGVVLQHIGEYWRAGGTLNQFKRLSMHDEYSDSLVFGCYHETDYVRAVMNSVKISKILREIGHCGCIGCIYKFDVECYPLYNVLVVRDDTESG